MLLCIIFEAVLFAILTFGSYFGYKQGFVKIALKPCKNIVCLGLSAIFCDIIGGTLVEPILIRISADRFQNTHLGQNNNVSTVFLPGRFVESAVDLVGSKIIEIISTFLAFILLFLMSKLLFSSLIGLINAIFDRGALGRVNKTVGLLCAGVISVLVAHLFAMGAQQLISLEEFNSSEITKGFFGGPLYRLFLRLNS